MITRFNLMLDRLEHERRHSMRRVLVAQEAERRRVAQELHDEIGQNLTAAVLELNRVREGGVVLGDALDDAQALARESLDTLSEITARLRPATFDDLGLASALQSLAADSERRTGIEVETLRRRRAARGSTRMPSWSCTASRRRRSRTRCGTAAARGSRSSCGATTARVVLRVTDDGAGLGDAMSGAGIRGMRERAAMIGGRLRFTHAGRGRHRGRAAGAAGAGGARCRLTPGRRGRRGSCSPTTTPSCAAACGSCSTRSPT